jgi:hypothetical protein
MQNRIHESVARLVMKSEDFEVLDGFCRGLLGARHDELRDRRTAQGCRTRDQLLLFGNYPRFQAVGF